MRKFLLEIKINIRDNEILYEMCRKKLKYKSADVVIGKIWLIGRSYAAAIEGRRSVSEIDSEGDFYFNIVAPKMLEIGEELDDHIDKLKKYMLLLGII